VSPERPFSQNGGVKTGIHPHEGLHLRQETLKASQGPQRAPTPDHPQRHPPAGKLPIWASLNDCGANPNATASEAAVGLRGPEWLREWLGPSTACHPCALRRDVSCSNEQGNELSIAKRLCREATHTQEHASRQLGRRGRIHSTIKDNEAALTLTKPLTKDTKRQAGHRHQLKNEEIEIISWTR
jgi:hypothetical protein